MASALLQLRAFGTLTCENFPVLPTRSGKIRAGVKNSSLFVRGSRRRDFNRCVVLRGRWGPMRKRRKGMVVASEGIAEDSSGVAVEDAEEQLSPEEEEDGDNIKDILRPQGAELKSSLWSGEVKKPFCENAIAFGSQSQHQSCNPASVVSFLKQDSKMHTTVSRRDWLLSSASLAAVVAIPSRAYGLSMLLDLGENNSETAGSSETTAAGDTVKSTKSLQLPAEDVKSWYRYRGEGFVLRIPPGYEDVLDPGDEEEESSSPYGERAKEKPFAARFASPDRDEVLSVVIKPASQLRLSFFETKDISDFGSIKDAAGTFVPAKSKLMSAQIINSNASRVPRTYYMYEFLTRGMHFTMLAGVSKGRVFVLGASAPEAKWKVYGRRLRLAASTFFLP